MRRSEEDWGEREWKRRRPITCRAETRSAATGVKLCGSTAEYLHVMMRLNQRQTAIPAANLTFSQEAAGKWAEGEVLFPSAAFKALIPALNIKPFSSNINPIFKALLLLQTDLVVFGSQVI